MNTKLRDCLLAAGGFAILVALVVVTDPPHATAGPGPAPVTVVNTGANPVPTTGTITNTPNVHAVQSGTWNVGVSGNVGITGTPNVNVANMPPVGIDPLNNTVRLLREPENPARQPFQANFHCDLLAGSGSCADVTSITTLSSSGKELVIEFVSVSEGLPTGQKAGEVTLQTTQGGNSVSHIFPLSLAFDDGTVANFVGAQQTRLYEEPSDVVTVECLRSASSGGGSCFGSVSGYLVDVP